VQLLFFVNSFFIFVAQKLVYKTYTHLPRQIELPIEAEMYLELLKNQLPGRLPTHHSANMLFWPLGAPWWHELAQGRIIGRGGRSRLLGQPGAKNGAQGVAQAADRPV
jgi:hypothetical protein